MEISSQEELLHSPMFQLSLSNKELFHSNFLYWMSKTYPQTLNSVLQKLCNGDILNTIDLESHREKDNFDLCWCDGNEVKIILENKVKSLPNKTQLDRYLSKGLYHILLSLARDFPNKDKIGQRWKIIHYDDLADALIEQIQRNAILNDYHQRLIGDYCKVIKILSQEVKEWQVDSETLFYSKNNQSKYLRINDLKQKLRFSKMALMLSERLHENGFVTHHEIYRDEMFKSFKPSCNTVFINFGITRSLGLLEVKIKVSNKLAYVVQIQGEHYRHALELYNTKQTDNENWTKYAIETQTSWFLRTNLTNNPFKVVGVNDDTELTVYPIITHKNKTAGYNKFGSEFLYQSVKIQSKMTVGDVLDSILHDCILISKSIK